MARLIVKIDIDSEKPLTDAQKQQLNAKVIECADYVLLNMDSCIEVRMIPVQPSPELRAAWATLRNRLPGSYQYLERYLEEADISSQRELLRLAQNIESEIHSAERRGARNFLTHGRL